MSQIGYHILANSIVISFNCKNITIDRNTDLATKIIELIKAGDLESIPELIDINQKLKKHANELFYIENNNIYSYGELVPEYITKKIVQFMEEDLPFEYLLHFWNNLKQNPSKTSQEALLGFLDSKHYTLTHDGHFIAYKRVNYNYTDMHTSTIDNSIGEVVKMVRDDVNADNTISCSYGLHIAPFDYAMTYQGGNGRLIQLKVNPRDVVSVPYNYQSDKARVCEYEVIGEYHEGNNLNDVHITSGINVDDIVTDKTMTSETITVLDQKTENIIDEHVQSERTIIRIGNCNYQLFEMHYESCQSAINGNSRITFKKTKPSKIPSKIVDKYDIESYYKGDDYDELTGYASTIIFFTIDKSAYKLIIA